MIGAVKPLAQVVVGTSDTVIYTGLAGSTAPVITYGGMLWVCNTDSVDRTFSLRFWLTGVLSADNALQEAQDIKARTAFYYNFHEPGFPIPTGYTLYGSASVAGKIVMTLFGAEQV